MRWDGAHYLAIARDGYGALDAPWVHWPFAPGLPLLISALAVVGRADVLAFAANQVLLLVALVGLHQLALRRAAPHAAALAVWALAFFPCSFVFSMTYPSALYLAASV
jgi:hypothetical protein